MAVEYTLEVDWDNDGTYGHARANVWGDLIAGTLTCKRGRDYASQIRGRSIAGTMSFELRNYTGDYDPLNTSGPLYGLLFGGRRVRFTMSDPALRLPKTPLWTGWIDEITNREAAGGADTVEVTALGVLARLDAPITLPQYTNYATGFAARRVFDLGATPIPSTIDTLGYDYQHLGGNVRMERWWVSEKSRLEVLDEIEDTEGGFLHERGDGYVGLDAFDHRQSAAARNSLLTLTDERGPYSDSRVPVLAEGLRPDQPLRDLANRVTIRIRRYDVDAQQVLWEAEGLVVPGSDSIEVVARYPTPSSPVHHLAVSSWTDLEAGVDYVQFNGVTVTHQAQGDELVITVTNSTGVDVTMDIQARGEPLVEQDPFVQRVSDQDSIDAYGLREYESPAVWLSNTQQATNLIAFLLALHKNPIERLTARWSANDSPSAAALRDLSDRVTVERRGTTYDYFIESIEHTIHQGGLHEVTYLLSPAGPYGRVIVLDDGPGLGTGVLAP